ncbi:hypothetical protein [Pontibacter virosus]|uniref:Uncharacterized protein n=1 Tax=Pontibacter virosus TaxID=1765052 RepID=A0A2U1B3N6_9BACT|nr:hypothetical protein [Pontibacter virosus]PVY43268.1 hypothetical protein C8E01_102447 [Pontibacter virosus]
MQDFKAYLAEIESLRLRSEQCQAIDFKNMPPDFKQSQTPPAGSPVFSTLKLDHYNPYSSDYRHQLKKLRGPALADVLGLRSEAAPNQLKLMRQVEERIKLAIQRLSKVNYRDIINDEIMGFDLYPDIASVFECLIVEDSSIKGDAGPVFILQLYHILFAKLRSVYGLREQLSDILDIREVEPGINYNLLTVHEFLANELYKAVIGHDKQSLVYLKTYRRVEEITKDEANWYNRSRNEVVFVVGEEWFKYRELKTLEEKWELFRAYTSQQICEDLQLGLARTVGGIKPESMQRRLAEIVNFIESTHNTGIGKALGISHSVRPDFKDEKEEYIRLTNGYYNTHGIDNDSFLSIAVYGEYVLFKEWLEEQLGNLGLKAIDDSINTSDKGAKEQPQLCFSDYLTGEGVKIYANLQEEYRGTRPARQVYMVKALEDFQAIKKNCELELTDFYKALINSFGGIWTREAYRKQFDKMNGGTSPRDEAKISKEKRIIKSFYQSLKVANQLHN